MTLGGRVHVRHGLADDAREAAAAWLVTPQPVLPVAAGELASCRRALRANSARAETGRCKGDGEEGNRAEEDRRRTDCIRFQVSGIRCQVVRRRGILTSGRSYNLSPPQAFN